MVKVHLDTDIGGDLDDVCALALLLTAPDVEITGVTTVLDDRGRRAGYARYVLDLAGQSGVPVAAGAEALLPCFREVYGLPPEARYWPEPVPTLPGPADTALDLLEQSIEQGARLIGIGPFTNLSLLEHRRPGILRGATLYLMAGSVQPMPTGFPAWDFTMDFNTQADALAARHVLESAEPSQITIVPIEVTAQTALRRVDLPRLRQAGPLGRLIAHQAEAFAEECHYDEQYGRTCAGLPSDIINFQHDPLACAVALGWPGVTIETLPLAITLEDGWLREHIDLSGRPFHVVTAVDQAAFGSFWLNTVTRAQVTGDR
jgi:inosine-uridine nucleoside N-ribohydrolase